jgi:hypothetical protein
MTDSSPKPEIQSISIVALGSFNPAIFQPRWLSSNGLIRDEEAVVAEREMQIIHRQVSIFSTEWFSLQVTDASFTIDSLDPTKSPALRDLAINIFNVLEHTPITAFGLNTNRHFHMKSEEEWHAFGDHYAPKDSWNAILIEPGMRSLTILGKRENCGADRVQVKIEPSLKVRPGVFIHVNQHYDLDEGKDKRPGERMLAFLTTLRDSWDGFLSYCDDVARHLLSETAVGE